MFPIPERFFLYLDILGFKELIQDDEKITFLYQAIDKLNVHKDHDFHTIVFSDTILVAADLSWNEMPRQAIMWLIEFSQDLFYRLAHRDIHFRAIVTKGQFAFAQMENYEAYHGKALIDSYLKEGTIKCCGTFLDNRLVRHSNIFRTSKYDQDVSFVHLMQHLDDISFPYSEYPISGDPLTATGMEYWTAYLIRYLSIVYEHAQNADLNSDVRGKFLMTWEMISKRHEGLLRRLAEANFEAAMVIEMDWSEPMRRIGTKEGAWG